MSLWKLLFGTPIGPRDQTVAEIVGRKVLKSEIKDLVSEPTVEDEKNKKAEFNPVLGKLAFLHHLASLYELEKEAPFKSEAQRRKFYAMESRGEISKKEVQKWESETPDKKLPERVEKKGGLLSWAGMGTTMLGKGKWLGTKGLGLGMMAADVGVQAAKQNPQPPRMASEVSRLIELTKQAIEVHEIMPITSDVCNGTGVKKKSLSKSSGLISAVSPGATARTISGLTKGPFSPTKGWLGRGTAGTPELTMGQGPVGKQIAGMSSEESVMAAGRGPHVQRGV